jgi:hypothetical protein
MKKTIKTITTCAIFLISFGNLAQVSILNQAGYGGSDSDFYVDIIQTSDGYYALVNSSSLGNTGNMTVQKFGERDYVLLKYDNALNLQWEKAFGGSDRDEPRSILLLDNHIYIIGESVSPISGNKTASSFGGQDVWVVKTDLAGNKVWDKSYGGSEDDNRVNAVQIGSEIFVGCTSESPDDGNKATLNKGGLDMWTFKIDANGAFTFQQSYGTLSDDYFTGVELHDADIFIYGISNGGANGDKSEPSYGFVDAWLLKLSQNGDVVWDRTFGGISDEYCKGVSFANDIIMLTIDSYSPASGNRTAPKKGFEDVWMVKLSESGALLDQFSFGGDASEISVGAVVYNNNFLVLASSSSGATLDKDEPAYGFRDFWLFYIDQYGTLLWQETIGGADDDIAQILGVFNDTLVIMGLSNSTISVDKTVPHYGDYDGWMMQLDITTLSTTNSALSKNDISIYPVPLQEKLYVNLEDAKLTASKVELYDNLGRIIISESLDGVGSGNQYTLNTSSIESGSYILRIHHEHGVVSKTLVK